MKARHLAKSHGPLVWMSHTSCRSIHLEVAHWKIHCPRLPATTWIKVTKWWLLSGFMVCYVTVSIQFMFNLHLFYIFINKNVYLYIYVCMFVCLIMLHQTGIFQHIALSSSVNVIHWCYIARDVCDILRGSFRNDATSLHIIYSNPYPYHMYKQYRYTGYTSCSQCQSRATYVHQNLQTVALPLHSNRWGARPAQVGISTKCDAI